MSKQDVKAMRGNGTILFCLKAATLVVTFIGGVLIGQVWWQPSCLSPSILKGRLGQDIPGGYRPSLKLKYPREFPAPKCTAEQRQADQDGICNFLRDYRIKESDRQLMLANLDYFLTLAKLHGWTFYICDGSLLGSWRHHGFIPYDYDIDLCVDVRHMEEITAIVNKHNDFKLHTDARGIAHIYSDSKASQNIFTATSGRWKWPFLDLFYYKDNGTHITRLPYPDRQRIKTDIFPLHNRPFEGFDIPAPRDPVKYVVAEYGYPKMDECRAIGEMNYKCSQLKHLVPFVYREFKGGVMIETLKLGDRVIHVKKVLEYKSNIPVDPFTLETVPPKHAPAFPLDMLDAALAINKLIESD